MHRFTLQEEINKRKLEAKDSEQRQDDWRDYRHQQKLRGHTPGLKSILKNPLPHSLPPKTAVSDSTVESNESRPITANVKGMR